MQVSSRRVSLYYNMDQLRQLTSSLMGPKIAQFGKIVKSRSPKGAIFRCSRLFSWLAMVLMDSTKNFDGKLTKNFGVSGASLSFYSEWKSSKITDLPSWATHSMSQTPTSERHLMAPNDIGTSRRLPQGVNGVGGRSCSSMSTDFQDF